MLTNFCSINQKYKDFDVVDPKNVVARVWHGRTNVWRGNYSAIKTKEREKRKEGRGIKTKSGER